MKRALHKVMKPVNKSALGEKKGGDALMLVAPKKKVMVSFVVDPTIKDQITELAQLCDVTFSSAARYVLEQNITTELNKAKHQKRR